VEKLKELLNKDKKTSNLILIVILLVILLISMNYIFSSEDENKEAASVLSENVISESNSVETKLSNIISKIEGVESAHVMISYSSTEKVIPVYDTKESVDTTTEEEKTSSKKTVEKTVAYEGENALLESKETAEATGAIIVVSGNVTEDVKLEIKEAVSMVTNVALHKVQIFVN